MSVISIPNIKTFTKKSQYLSLKFTGPVHEIEAPPYMGPYKIVVKGDGGLTEIVGRSDKQGRVDLRVSKNTQTCYKKKYPYIHEFDAPDLRDLDVFIVWKQPGLLAGKEFTLLYRVYNVLNTDEDSSSLKEYPLG